MLNEVFLFLLLLQIKHWYIDFVDQTEKEVVGKGIYGNGSGIAHSFKHGVGTFLAVILITGWFYYVWAIILAVIDFILHYHIDWLKININKKHNYTPQDKNFWVWLGADQLAHQITYLFLAWIVFA